LWAELQVIKAIDTTKQVIKGRGLKLPYLLTCSFVCGRLCLVSLLICLFIGTSATSFEIDGRIPPDDYSGIRAVFRHWLSHYATGIRVFVTEDDRRGSGYPGIQHGDLVCIVYGSNVPQILRQVDTDDDDHYILVGACTVDGLMHGEGLEMGLTEREFILV
jgi:hypothetical protein